jgi:hypothetical protein
LIINGPDHNHRRLEKPVNWAAHFTAKPPTVATQRAMSVIFAIFAPQQFQATEAVRTYLRIATPSGTFG